MTAPRRGSGGERGNRSSGEGRGSAGSARSGAPRGGFRGGAGRPAGGTQRRDPAEGGRASGPRRDGHKNTGNKYAPPRDDKAPWQGGRSAGARPARSDAPTDARGPRPTGDRPQWQDRRPQGERGQGAGRPGADRSGSDRGGWQERRPEGGRPQRSGGQSGDRPQWQDRRPQNERPQGDRPQRPAGPRRGGAPADRPRADRPQGDRPQWQDRRPQGDRPQRSGGASAGWQERRPQRDRPQGERPQWQDRRPEGQRPQGDRPQRDRRPQGERPQRQDRSGQADRPQGARPQGDRPQWQDRRPQGDRPQRGSAPRPDRGGSGDWRDRRPSRAPGADRGAADRQDRRPPLPPGPDLPEWADPRDLDGSIRAALRGLDPRNAERVAGHLVAAGTLVDDDPQAALAHARAARDRASRVAAVREAVGVAAYHAGDYAEAAREIRAYRRMSGDAGYRAVLADCERALGRPEVALRLVAEALADTPDAEETVELRLVEAGARRDLGEDAAARLVLEAALGGRPDPASLTVADPARLRIASAYADLLGDLGEEERAAEWLTAVAAVDPEDGIEFTELEEVEADNVDEHTSELEASIADEPGNVGADFDADVEAEVAELLGEVEPPGPDQADRPDHPEGPR